MEIGGHGRGNSLRLLVLEPGQFRHYRAGVPRFAEAAAERLGRQVGRVGLGEYAIQRHPSGDLFQAPGPGPGQRAAKGQVKSQVKGLAGDFAGTVEVVEHSVGRRLLKVAPPGKKFVPAPAVVQNHGFAEFACHGELGLQHDELAVEGVPARPAIQADLADGAQARFGQQVVAELAKARIPAAAEPQQTGPTGTAIPLVLSVDQAAERLQVSRGTIYTLMKSRELGWSKVRGRLRILATELDRYLTQTNAVA